LRASTEATCRCITTPEVFVLTDASVSLWLHGDLRPCVKLTRGGITSTPTNATLRQFILWLLHAAAP
jgi:hypothetical protein